MYRGTTPTYTFILPETVDISLASQVYVTFCKMNGDLIYTKTGDDLNIAENSVEVYLTQEETLKFPNGSVQVQLNWIYSDENKDKRACSEIMTITAKKNLIDEVISDE